MARHPAPPFYRTARPGKGVGNSRVSSTDYVPSPEATVTDGKPPNASVVPLVYTNRIGERVLYEPRQFHVTSPKVILD